MTIPKAYIKKEWRRHWTYPVFTATLTCSTCGEQVKAGLNLVPTTSVRRFSCEYCHTQFCLQFKQDHCSACHFRTIDCLTIQIVHTDFEIPTKKWRDD